MFWHRTTSEGTVGSHLLDWPGKYISRKESCLFRYQELHTHAMIAGRHAKISDILGAEPEGHPGASLLHTCRGV